MSLLVDLFICRKDNYGYVLHDTGSGKTAVVDAPDADAIKASLAKRGWGLDEIFITHHHIDHVEGIPALVEAFGARVTGPAAEADKIKGLNRLVLPGDSISLGETSFAVMGAPGHTLGHIVLHDAAGGHLFTADALFSMGVGRMFEGTPGPMWAGLLAMRALPDATQIYCGHEYTVANAKFALSVDPHNAALQARAAEVDRLRASDDYTIPIDLGTEKRTNPFLRADTPEMAAAMGLPQGDAVAVFAALRKAKDVF